MFHFILLLFPNVLAPDTFRTPGVLGVSSLLQLDWNPDKLGTKRKCFCCAMYIFNLYNDLHSFKPNKIVNFI